MNQNNFKKQSVIWLKENKYFLVVLALLILCSNLFLYQFYRQEKYIYFWDWSAYQNHFIFIVAKLHLGVFPALGALLYSIAFTEYSLLAPFIISLLGIIFGTSRAVFLFSILNVFALPASFLIGLVFAKLTDAKGKRKWLFTLMPMAIILLTPQFWIPLLLGFFDVITLVWIACVWLILSSDQEKRTWQKAAGVGLLLTLLIFTRRWFGYWSFSFFPAIFLQWLHCKVKKQKLFWELKTIVVCGLTSAAFLLIFGAPIAKQMLTDNYANMFSAFKGGNSTWQVILAAVYHYGWLTMLFAGAGFFWALKDSKVRPVAQIIGLQTLITLLLFARVQLIDLHHHYQFLIAAVLFESLFIFYLWQKQIRRSWKILITLLFAIILLTNFFQALIPQLKLNFRPWHLMANAEHYPLIRNDQAQISSLVKYLDQTMPQGTTLYVDASSLVLNDDVIRNSCRYLSLPQIRVCNNIIFASNVDLRDGLPRQFPNADFILVPSPAQTHLRPIDQRVIWVLGQQLMDKNSIGAAYTTLPVKFTLDGGVIVNILKRNRPLTPDELQNLSNLFLVFYPSRTDLFQIMPNPQTPGTAQGSATLAQKIKSGLKKILGTDDIKVYFRQKLGGSDVTGETSY